jgi:ABC-type transport system involved in multi-copper enzyme maturation permease subunit
MLWSRRSVFLATVVGGGVLLALVVRTVVTIEPRALPRIEGMTISGLTLFGLMIWLLYIRFIVPILGVFYGTSLIADEIEERTITYLFTRPVSRGAVLLGKYMAYVACTVLLVLPSVVLVYFLVVPLGGSQVGAGFPTLAIDLGILALGLAAYGALFALVGALFKRPVVAGLIYAFGFEPAVLLIPGYLRQLTIGYYLQGLVPHAMPQDSSTVSLLQTMVELPVVPLSIISLAGITGVALWLAMRTVENREYVLDQ